MEDMDEEEEYLESLIEKEEDQDEDEDEDEDEEDSKVKEVPERVFEPKENPDNWRFHVLEMEAVDNKRVREQEEVMSQNNLNEQEKEVARKYYFNLDFSENGDLKKGLLEMREAMEHISRAQTEEDFDTILYSYMKKGILKERPPSMEDLQRKQFGKSYGGD